MLPAIGLSSPLVVTLKLLKSSLQLTVIRQDSFRNSRTISFPFAAYAATLRYRTGQRPVLSCRIRTVFGSTRFDMITWSLVLMEVSFSEVHENRSAVILISGSALRTIVG